jgi:hypothetical protein
MSVIQPTDPPPPRSSPPDGRPPGEGGPREEHGGSGGGWEKAKVLATAADALARVLDLILRH